MKKPILLVTTLAGFLLVDGKGTDFVDNGLYDNPAVKDETLKNIGATALYTHNGVFKDLKTVIHFHNTRDVAGAVNLE